MPDAPAAQRRSLPSLIHLIHDEIDQQDLDQAHSWLTEAHTICFLGFGYNRINVARLRMNEPHPNAVIWGTTCGLEPIPFQKARSRFADSNNLHLEKTRRLTCRQYFLQEFDLPT